LLDFLNCPQENQGHFGPSGLAGLCSRGKYYAVKNILTRGKVSYEESLDTYYGRTAAKWCRVRENQAIKKDIEPHAAFFLFRTGTLAESGPFQHPQGPEIRPPN
jgi:hypothetical protein